MLYKIQNEKITWYNLSSPTKREIEEIRKKFDFHPLVVSELAKPTLRSRVNTYNDTLYLILHFPIFDPKKKSSISKEIDFVIGKDFLITAHYGTIEPFDKFVKLCQSDENFCNQYLSNNNGHLFYTILKHLYEFSFRQLDHIDKKIEKIEDKIFDGYEREMVREISILRRDILDFRRAISPQKTVLSSLEKVGSDFFLKSFLPYLSYLSGEYYRVWHALENYKETIEALQETNESLLSTKTNEVMKILTIMAFVTFPLSLVASIFGMNTKILPIVGKSYDFWIITGGMVTATLLMFLFFKKKKWL